MEGALLELITLIKISELDLTKNPQGLNNVSATIDYDTKIISGDFSIPVVVSVSESGTLTTTAVNYLTGLAYTIGASTNTLKSNNAIAALMELIQRIQLVEATSAKNPQNVNRITGKIDNEGLTFAGTIELELLVSIDSIGNTVFSAKEYLLN